MPEAARYHSLSNQTFLHPARYNPCLSKSILRFHRAPANKTGQEFILVLVKDVVARYPNFEFSYIILERSYDTEEIHQDIIFDHIKSGKISPVLNLNY
ncbi:hypothetical protein ACFL0M_08795 [Thermodesulfobacteriota bacterium]